MHAGLPRSPYVRHMRVRSGRETYLSGCLEIEAGILTAGKTVVLYEESGLS